MSDPKPTDDLTDQLAGLEHNGSSSCSGHGYLLELRYFANTTKSPVLFGLQLSERWQAVPVQCIDGQARVEGAIASLPLVLPTGRMMSRAAAERGLLPYSSVIALRAYIVAVLGFDAICVQSRIVRIAYSETYKQTEEGVMEETDLWDRSCPDQAEVRPRREKTEESK